MKINKKILLISILLIGTLILAGCGGNGSKQTSGEVKEITIGYFPNLTHAPGIIGKTKGFFAEEFGNNVKVNVKTFPKGSLLMDALATDQIDIGYAGPGPVLNRFLQGAKVKLLASASIGGNVIVGAGDSNIKNPKDLANKRIATPGLACSHDLVLRKLLWNNNLKMERRGGTIEQIMQKPATMMGLFKQDQIDAAAVSEPWAAVMEKKIGAKVLVDWNEMPWEGRMPATVVVTTSNFTKKHPELVKQFLKANEKSIEFITNNKDKSLKLIQKEIKRITRQKIALDILDRALTRTKFTSQVDPKIIQELADISGELGVIQGDTDLTGLVDTTFLKQIKN
ncbi:MULTISPECIES: aliphatic sulfonate ABC transporter substrate-binding protein [unclassified Candidatus Frackibacter]|uniref:aliphatic sulfonate ABC transporter substrate-binding protein n=1 Tax=unclassified Candidatus Frackibacter TaxID=2648818 RepID=UPI0008829EC3|nr:MULTISPECIES: aliphatic sulfonate ABC transporter substrate-binding protein [unclassified Candidatus Frackibacter]SDC48331.1 NitT/TauT family transport system substrate-binding protein [Candidatus Frackibacter sp. WG11]SEM95562.1 NitT/TauT family transport system substrate-binding protein [Candidatus Frackibacter sp. WG12]SFL73471.1 NitT/TauT family transport system substrate-binding protein [Candidatus Frackibacter sp. WG13]